MPVHSRAHRRHAPVVTLIALTGLLVACGGEDQTSDAPDVTAAAPDTPDTPDTLDTPDTGGAGDVTPVDGSTIRDGLTDAMGDAGGTVDEVLGSMSAESRFNIVVDQLDPAPTLEIDGASIRFVFDSGSVQDAILPCMVGGTFLEAGETLTVSYPDGEQTC
jgi:hypothetical protein